MSEPSSQPQPSHGRTAPVRDIERYWIVPASIAILLFVLNLVTNPLRPPPNPAILNMVGIYDFSPLLFCVVGIKAVVLMIRRREWPQLVMILATGVFFANMAIGGDDHPWLEMRYPAYVLGWMLLALGYYWWSAKTSRGESITGIPLALQMILFSVLFVILLGWLLADSYYPRQLLFLFTGRWGGLPYNSNVAIIGIMLVASVFRSIRVGGRADWLQFAGLGISFVIYLTLLVVDLQVPSPPTKNEFHMLLTMGYLCELIAPPGLILFAIGFFAARPAPEARDET